MRKAFVEKTFKKRISLPPIDGVWLLDEEDEFTPEEWDYYEELARQYGRDVAAGKVKSNQDIGFGG